MTTPTITCEQFSDGLADLLERDADESTRSRLEAHALSCGECGPLLADLRKLRIDAAALPELAPQHDLWTGIAARIETPIVELTPAGVGGGKVERWKGGKEPRRLAPLWIGLAAAGLVAVTATITHQITKRPVVTSAPVTPAAQIATVAPTTTPVVTPPTRAPDSVPPFHLSTVPPSLVANKTSAEQTYDAEINRLRTIVVRRRSVLDSATVVVIERNLKVIDDAIAQCRAALRKDPASQFLMESLNEALDTKVQLLRTAARLPART